MLHKVTGVYYDRYSHYQSTNTSPCDKCNCKDKSTQTLGQLISADLRSVGTALGINSCDLSVLLFSMFHNDICLCMFSIELCTNDHFLYGITNSFGTTRIVCKNNAKDYLQSRTPIEFRSFKYGQLFYLLWDDFNQNQPTEEYKEE